jgi:hypothetical protein
MKTLIATLKRVRTVVSYGLICFVLSVYFTPTLGQGEVTVHQPVSGSFVRNINMRLLEEKTGIVDTGDSTWSLLETSYQLSASPRPLWAPSGQEIAFRFIGKHAGTVDVTDGSVTFITEDIENIINTSFDVTSIRGWFMNHSSLLVTYSAATLNTYTSMFIIDRENNTVEEIRSWQTNQQVADMPLPPNVTSMTLGEGYFIQHNPVFDDWLRIHFTGLGYYSNMLIADEPRGVELNVLWNFRTNQYISLDAIAPDLRLDARFIDWSHDGTRLLLQAISKDLKNVYIVTFHFTPDEGITLIERVIIENRIPEHWLDAGSLFFSRIQNYDGGAAYVLGEIVDGEYREVPFFTLNGEQFDRESFGDWFMRADEAERAELSCIFEWSLPTQLGIGDSPEVVSSSGLTLRERPDRFSPALRSLPQGTVVTIIGGEACSDGYRWWPVRLPDGTEGFVAEADTSEYFLVP